MQLEINKKEKVFSNLYPILTKELDLEGSLVKSRNGMTKEILNNHIEINPLFSCTGGFERNINIFFLMAEALWIWSGRRDVKFLDMFNSNMKNYSDNGVYFNAPYGWRLRNWGVDANIQMDNVFSDDEINHIMQGRDQIREQILNLHNDSETRQAVLSIWDPEFDNPEVKTRDRACNDMLMYKLRQNENKDCQYLYGTIANRSNDLHWGLPTNVFQFSFIGKVIAAILSSKDRKVKYVSQVHNSQSLHFYSDNDIQERLIGNMLKHKHMFVEGTSFYDFCSPYEICFNSSDSVKERLKETDFFINSIISHLIIKYNSEDVNTNFELEDDLRSFCPSLYKFYKLLSVYVEYKKEKNKEEGRFVALGKILSLFEEDGEIEFLDIELLSLNFFLIRNYKNLSIDDYLHTINLLNANSYVPEKILENFLSPYFF